MVLMDGEDESLSATHIYIMKIDTLTVLCGTLEWMWDWV